MTTTTRARNSGNGRVTPRKPRPVAPAAEDPVPVVSPPVPTIPAASASPAGKLAVLKVLVQPTFVLVAPDGSCREVKHDVIEINGADWATWAPTSFNDDVLDALRQTVVVQPRGGQA